MNYYALVTPKGTTRHFVGASAQRIAMPAASMVLLVADSDSGFLLIRYSSTACFAGDTWHASEDDARSQVGHEFEEGVEWKVVEGEFENWDACAKRIVASRMSD